MDGVIHVAGIHDYSTPDKVIFAVNVGGVKNICDAVEKAGVSRFVHFSSVGVYGYNSNPGHPVKEDDPKVTPPLNNYNLSKWEGEQILQGYMKEPYSDPRPYTALDPNMVCTMPSSRSTMIGKRKKCSWWGKGIKSKHFFTWKICAAPSFSRTITIAPSVRFITSVMTPISPALNSLN
ncbi:MAG: NAD(P)-dependent oxidoreductase [Deltaproteobacteria bacterium]|nr:NAD(P)-dependent oxidoreductase [Deltaproteobacteria bacterium]